MIFLTSLIYATALFVLPGELLLMGLASAVPWVPTAGALAGLNLLAYGVVFVIVHLGRRMYTDFRLGEGKFQEVRLTDWLEINHCRWLNIVGLIGIAIGAALLAGTGWLAVPFWFLYAAIVVGSLDVLKKTPLVALPSSLPTSRISLVTPSTSDAGKTVQFAWRPWPENGLAGDEFKATFVINTDDYQKARGQKRYPADKLENYVRYVQEQFGAVVPEVASHLRRLGEEKGFTAVEELGNAVGFTRSIAYASDEDTRGVPDWANFPIETLYDEAGDCEDHAILAAAILHHLGHDVALFFLKLDDGGHLALGCQLAGGAGPFSAQARNGREYFYVETVPTSDDERIGDISEEFLNRIRDTSVVPVAQAP